MAKDEAKIKFTAETSEFTAGIRNANSTLAALRAGLKLNEAEFKNTGDSAEYLTNKQKLLKLALDANKDKQDALSEKLEKAKEIYGENSTEVQEWTLKLTRAKTEEQELTASLTACENQVDQLNSELDQSEDALNDAGEAAEDAGEKAEESVRGWTMAKQILADLTKETIGKLIDALKDAAKEMINMGMDFTSSMSNVQALSGATGEELARLESRAKSLGRSTTFSASQVADGFSYMALAGWDVNDMLAGKGGITSVLRLAEAANMDLAKASDIVTDYLTAFGLEAQDSGQFVDQMAYAMANSNTNVEQLGEAYKNCASTARSMGYSVEDTTAALMVMANAGVKGGEAGTGLSSIMTRLATNTKECADGLAEYGVYVYDSQGKMNSLSSILNGCAEVWSTLTQEEQANLAKTIAGTSQYSKFQTIMAGLSEQAKENGMSFNDYTVALENCQGAAEEMSAIMNDNLSGDMKALGSAAEGLGLQMFTFFEGPLRTVAKTATDLLNGVTDYITPAKSELELFIEDINKSNDEVQKALDNASGIISNATADVGELEAYKDVLINLNSQSELTKFQQYQLRNAVTMLSGKVPGLADAFDEASGSLTVTNEELVKMFQNAEALALQQALIDAQAESYKALAEAELAKAKADSALSVATAEYNEISEKNKETVGWLEGGYGELYGKVMDAQIAMENASDAQIEASLACEAARKQIEEEKIAFEPLIEQCGLAAESVYDLADGETAAGDAAADAEDDISGFGMMTEEEMRAAQEAAEEAQKAFVDMRNGIRDAMQDSVSFMNEFSGGAEITAEDIVKHLDSQISGIQIWSDNMLRLSQETGNGMSQAMYDALVQMGPDSANLVKELINTLDNDTEQFQAICQKWTEAMTLSDNAEAIASYTESGRQAAGTYASGLSEGADSINTAAGDLMSGAGESMDPGSAIEPTEEFVDNVVTTIDTGSEEVTSSVENMSEGVKTGYSEAFQEASTTVDTETKKINDTLKKVVDESSRNLSNGLSQMESSVEKTTSSISDSTLKIGNSFMDIARTAEQQMSNAARNVERGVSDIKNALSVTLRGPNIQVPHFSMSGSFNAQTNSVPHVNVSWHAKGVVFNKPTLLPTLSGIHGVGEVEPEATAPISVLQSYVEHSVEKAGRNMFDYDLFSDKISSAIKKLNMAIRLGEREFGRVVSEV